MELKPRLKVREQSLEHTQRHLELVRSFVEERLSGEEKRQATQNILSCPPCLSEYNEYRLLWRLISSRAYLGCWEDYLKERNPQRSTLLNRVLSEVHTGEALPHAPTFPAPSAPAFASLPWRRIARGLALALALTALWAVYEVTTLRKTITRQEAYYKNLLAESQRINQTALEGRMTELNRRIDELTLENRNKSAEIQELRRHLAGYTAPNADAVVSLTFPAAFPRTNDVQTIPVRDTTLFLDLRIPVSGIRDYKAYSVSLADKAGKTVWQDDRAAKNKQSVFNVRIPNQFSQSGDYTLRIYGLETRQQKLLAQRHLRISVGT